MNIVNKSLIDLIGNTPMLKVDSFDTGLCELYLKLENQNPGGSIKDRIGLSIIQEAEKNGDLVPGGTIVEATAGNTGIGLCLVGNSLGLESTIVIPRSQSREKKDMLRLCGAKLIEVDALPYSNPGNYIRVSEKISKEITNPNGVLWANQFDNLSNKKAHFLSTGPEIYDSFSGNLDGFICSIGTGGTIAGVSSYLKEKDKEIKVCIADPMGSAMFNYFKNGILKSTGTSITEGIGQGRITKNLENVIIDDSFQISDTEALKLIFEMLKHEGLILGGSSGINIMGAIKLGKELGPNKNIVTILCDYGTKYQSKIFNKEFLESKNLPIPEWL